MRESVIFQAILQEGEEQGRQEGRQEVRQELAINLLREDVSVDFISQVTGLSLAQIELLSQPLFAKTEA